MQPSPFQNRLRRIPDPTPEQEEAALIADIKNRGNPYIPRAKTIKSIVKGWTIQRNISAEQTSLMTEQQWRAAVGDPMSGYTRPGNLKRGVLHVTVDSPLVMQELTMRKNEILKHLQANLPEHQIKSLRFKIS